MKKKSLSESAFFSFRLVLAAVFCLAGAFVALLGVGALSSAFAQGKGFQNNRFTTSHASPGTQTPDVVRMVGPVRLDQDLRSLPYIAPAERIEEERRLTRFPLPETGAPLRTETSSPWLRSLLKGLFRPTPTMPPPLLTFDGMNATDACGTCTPPDTDGDVGPNHYIEALNVAFRVFDKSGNPLTPVTTFNSFFAPLVGTPCGAGLNENQGDPFVFYDQIADRWVVSDFAFCNGPFYECIAVSQTGDPVSGGWFLYALQHDPMNPDRLGDYPKFALWPDAYYLTMNEYTQHPPTFMGVRVYALDRASMISGGPANAIGFTIDTTGLGDSSSLLAANFRTGDPPPAGEQEFLLAIDSRFNLPLTQVHGWLFHADFVNPGNSTLGIGANHSPNAQITVNGFVNAVTTTEFLVPQRDGVGLDTLGERMMTPVVYQNRDGSESLWADHTILLNSPAGPTAVRWYQFDVTGGNFSATPVQQQDWSNGNDGLWRWMPSIAVDQNGNTAIGYSTSSEIISPSIRYAGRLVSDPLSNLGQGEAIMTNGSGSQVSGGRWGDYTMTTIDPTNGMSFWHVNEYYSRTLRTGTNWRTSVGAFNFIGGPTPTPTPDCNWSDGPPDLIALKRAVGVYFPDGNFYAMGGRQSDTPGEDFPMVERYSPSSERWITMGVDLPDNQVSEMACGVLTVSGTPYIYCVGGSAVGATTATARVFFYDPATDSETTLTAEDNWPGNAAGTILPGGFAVVNNKLYILGGFSINVASTNQIWQFDPTAGVGSKWTQMVNTPEGIMYAPTCAINGIIYVGGASDYVSGSVIDTRNSFSFNPATNSIGTIAAIPRATGETRALGFNDGLGAKMYVMGGGQVPPNPSSQVDVYNPATNTWAIAEPFAVARRNFPADTDGTDHIWVWGGYASGNGDTTLEIFSCRPTSIPRPSPTPAPRPTPR